MLDQVPVPAGSSAAQAVAASVELAVAVEALGYRRYWVAEHHNTPSLASASPEVVVAAVAARTTSIRVGSGGVLLSHYSPLKVAETFRLLDALAPGRVDLGVGRTPGTDPVTEAALQYRPGALGDEHFAQKVVDLLGFLDGTLDPGHPYSSVRAVPTGRPGDGPDVWVLGSSSTGAAAAAYLGLPFAFAHFITERFGPQILQSYRKGFTPSARLAGPERPPERGAGPERPPERGAGPERPPERGAGPRALVAVSVVCADTDAEAARLATSLDVWRLRPEGAERGPLLPPDEAAAVALSPLDRDRVAQHRAALVVGDPARVRLELEELAASFGVDELVVLTVCHDPAARLRSYHLLAEAFDLR